MSIDDGKIPCTQCGALILPATATKTGGLCMACKQGIRSQIEKSKKFYEESKKYDPYRELWASLVSRVHHSKDGVSDLTDDERLYYSVGLLDGEVYNGGFDQYFTNSSGDTYKYAIDGLLALRADESLNLLLRAKEVLFDDKEPHLDCEARRDYLRKTEKEYTAKLLDELDKLYYKDPDGLGEKLNKFVDEKGLLKPFLK